MIHPLKRLYSTRFGDPPHLPTAKTIRLRLPNGLKLPTRTGNTVRGTGRLWQNFDRPPNLTTVIFY